MGVFLKWPPVVESCFLISLVPTLFTFPSRMHGLDGVDSLLSESLPPSLLGNMRHPPLIREMNGSRSGNSPRTKPIIN
uniref:Putative secreted protein n=1 Tax=Anopheles triannulatus TaxID=58253 RepID=A0A2M4B7B3_9DIPT